MIETIHKWKHSKELIIFPGVAIPASLPKGQTFGFGNNAEKCANMLNVKGYDCTEKTEQVLLIQACLEGFPGESLFSLNIT